MSRDLLYEKLIRPILFSLDPENVHYFAQSVLGAGAFVLPALGSLYTKDDLRCDLFGEPISNPIGLAAGFDKNALLLPHLGQLGFGFAEIGSVCARPHGGNTRPRVFRLPEDNALINRLGLNGFGADFVASRLSRMNDYPLPIGVNIAKTNDARLQGADAVADMVFSFDRIKDLPLRYVTINTSCPNTDEGCLKESKILEQVLDEINAVNNKALPLLLKLSPDSSDAFIEELVKISISRKLSGFVCGNTSLSRAGLTTGKERLDQIGNGGLSGKPLKRLNLELTRKVARLKDPSQIIIGVGGVQTGHDAYDYLVAGAHCVQIYTGFVYRGPFAVKQICEELSAIFKSKGISLQQLQANFVSTV